MLKRCNCDFRNPNESDADPIKMYITTDEIFDEEKYKKLVTQPINGNEMDLKMIIANESIKNYPNGWKPPVSKETANDDSDCSSEEKFPPVEAEPICIDKLTINVILSKANPSE